MTLNNTRDPRARSPASATFSNIVLLDKLQRARARRRDNTTYHNIMHYYYNNVAIAGAVYLDKFNYNNVSLKS